MKCTAVRRASCPPGSRRRPRQFARALAPLRTHGRPLGSGRVAAPLAPADVRQGGDSERAPRVGGNNQPRRARPPRDDASSGPPPAPAPASSSPPTTAPPRRSFGIPDGTPTARAKLVNAERGTGGALLNGFSCESGSNAGVWDKIVTPARRS